jgi:hypothetical protein
MDESRLCYMADQLVVAQTAAGNAKIIADLTKDVPEEVCGDIQDALVMLGKARKSIGCIMCDSSDSVPNLTSK